MLLLSQALISVLKEHNHILGMLRIDLGTMSTFLQKVALDATETRSLVNNIKDELKIHVREREREQKLFLFSITFHNSFSVITKKMRNEQFKYHKITSSQQQQQQKAC